LVPQIVTVADLNGDNNPDLIVKVPGTTIVNFQLQSQLQVYLSNGNGTFKVQLRSPSERTPTASQSSRTSTKTANSTSPSWLKPTQARPNSLSRSATATGRLPPLRSPISSEGTPFAAPDSLAPTLTTTATSISLSSIPPISAASSMARETVPSHRFPPMAISCRKT
jgi:hypothetical protein